MAKPKIMQLPFSPYYTIPDFAGIARAARGRDIDQVSVADILRNAFVYPPNSMYTGLKLSNFGFDPESDPEVEEPTFKFRFHPRGPSTFAGDVQPWVDQYHSKLCDAVAWSTASMAHPWQLQSGGKDSTSIAIALAEVRPDAVCMTYLGGTEENELDSAGWVARQLGLRHETLVCDPGRAYDRYLAMVGNMPLLTGDFATLSYADLVTEIKGAGGDGVVDGLGSDVYFGMLVSSRDQLLSRLSLQLPLPIAANGVPLVERNFKLSFILATLQMHPIERSFPGSRFTDSEVDALFGWGVSQRSRQRLEPFLKEINLNEDRDVRRAVALSITEPMEAFAKGMYTCDAIGIKIGYPYCNMALRTWIQNEVPMPLRNDPVKRTNKVLVREHIDRRLGQLPYVNKKGSFRFDLRGLASARFDQVHDFAVQVGDMMPGAVEWLERNRSRLGNKYHASKFYLMALVLPWMLTHAVGRATPTTLSPSAAVA